LRLQGKVAVVTGGGHGIGRAAALLMSREGAAVALADVDASAGAAVRDAIAAEGAPAVFLACDVGRADQVQRLIGTVEDTFGRLDILFNNAGVEQPACPSHALEEEVFDRVIATNLKGVFLGCRYALPAMMRAGGGAIVNNASVAAFANTPGTAAYAAAQGGIMSLTRVLALEDAAQGIRVNAAAPGVIDTGMNRRHLQRTDNWDAPAARWRAVTPLGRLGTAEEVAEAVVYLACDQSAFVTGIGLVVDGGSAMTAPSALK